jgi:hypothetical protein
LFVFDWHRDTNRHELIVRPAEPLITSHGDRLTSLSSRMFVRIGGKLKRMSLPEGPPQTICDATSGFAAAHGAATASFSSRRTARAACSASRRQAERPRR